MVANHNSEPIHNVHVEVAPYIDHPNATCGNYPGGMEPPIGEIPLLAPRDSQGIPIQFLNDGEPLDCRDMNVSVENLSSRSPFSSLMSQAVDGGAPNQTNPAASSDGLPTGEPTGVVVRQTQYDAR